jgi:peptidyl-prolyl cis-trans isomerase C
MIAPVRKKTPVYRSFRFISLVATLVASAAFAAKPVLQVNNTQVTDLDLKLAQQRASITIESQTPGEPPKPEKVMRYAVAQLIARTLLLQAAHEANITVSAAQVAANIEQQRADQGSAVFAQYLANLGMTELDFSRRVEDEMVVRKFVETTVATGLTVTDADAKTFYDANPATFEHPEEVKLRCIVLHLDQNADETQVATAKARAENVRKRLLVGDDMAMMAKEVSDDPSKASGGEIGWIRKGTLLPELEAAVWALKPRELSPVLKSQHGHHIFLMEERRVAGKVSFDEVKARLVNALKSERLATAVETLVKERSAKATIQPLDPAVSAALGNGRSTLVASPPLDGKPALGPTSSSPHKP